MQEIKRIRDAGQRNWPHSSPLMGVTTVLSNNTIDGVCLGLLDSSLKLNLQLAHVEGAVWLY